jgi:hypothetical protein
MPGLAARIVAVALMLLLSPLPLAEGQSSPAALGGRNVDQVMLETDAANQATKETLNNKMADTREKIRAAKATINLNEERVLSDRDDGDGAQLPLFTSARRQLATEMQQARDALDRHKVTTSLQTEIIGMSQALIPRETIVQHILTFHTQLSEADANDIVIAANVMNNRVLPRRRDTITATNQEVARKLEAYENAFKSRSRADRRLDVGTISESREL